MLMTPEIVVCNEETKMRILSSLEGIHNYVFITEERLKDMLYGYADKEAYIYLMNRYHINYDFCKNIIKYIPYVDVDMEYESSKLRGLQVYKRELIDRGLFFMPDYELELSRGEVILSNYEDTPLYHDIVSKLRGVTKVKYFDDVTGDLRPRYYEYETQYLEGVSVMNEIIELYKKGVKLSKIFINNLDGDTLLLYKRLARNYGIPVDFAAMKNVSCVYAVGEVLRLSRSMNSFKEIFDDLSARGIKSVYLDKVFDLIVEYRLFKYKPSEAYELLTELVRDMKFEKTKYKDMVCCGRKREYLSDEYVFFINCSQSGGVVNYKDDLYLSDEELSVLRLETSTIKNRLEKKKLTSLITTTPNLYLSYSKRVGKDNDCKACNIISDLKLEVNRLSVGYGYSQIEDDLRLAMAYQKFLRLKEMNPVLEEFDLNRLEFNSFDNSFKSFDTKHSKVLSYSSMNTLMMCPFQYYCKNVLKLGGFEDTIATRLGSATHYVLEKSYSPDFDLSKACLEAIDTILIDKDEDLVEYKLECFYFNKLIPYIKECIDYNREYEKLDSHINELEVKLDGELPFYGKIDKVMYKTEGDDVYIALYDYKSSDKTASIKNLSDGYNMQLPIYLYLISKCPEFIGKNIHYLGTYYQTVSIPTLKGKKDRLDEIRDSFRLIGYTNVDEALMDMIVDDPDESRYIKSLYKNKDGEYSKDAKLLASDEFVNITKIIECNIDESYEKIRNNDFSVSPKKLGSTLQCTNCEFYDICFVNASNIVYVKKEEDEERGCDEDDEEEYDDMD